MAVKIVENAKVSRPSTCNAMETLLVHRDVAQAFLKKLAPVMKATASSCVVTTKPASPAP